LQTFLEEICHPYKNWEFIVKEARGYALNYFHVLRTHPKGPEAARLYIDIFSQAIDSSRDEKLRINASDNLLSFIQKIIKDAGTDLLRFLPVLDYTFDRIRHCPKKTFALFVKSFYQLNRIGWSYSQAVPSESSFTAINHLLIRYFRYTYDYWLEQVDPLVWFEKESGKAGLDKIFRPVSLKQLKACQKRLESIVSSSDHSPKTILGRIDFRDMVKSPPFTVRFRKSSLVPEMIRHREITGNCCFSFALWIPQVFHLFMKRP
jgi:pyruvate,orthophosphate dikinase